MAYTLYSVSFLVLDILLLVHHRAKAQVPEKILQGIGSAIEILIMILLGFTLLKMVTSFGRSVTEIIQELRPRIVPEKSRNSLKTKINNQINE